MYPPYKFTLPPEDRATFEKWLRGIATFYACVAVLIVCAFAVLHSAGGTTRNDVVATTTSSAAIANPPAAMH
jgi:hypothetical protein